MSNIDMKAIEMNIKKDWKLNRIESRNFVSKNNLLIVSLGFRISHAIQRWNKNNSNLFCYHNEGVRKLVSASSALFL